MNRLRAWMLRLTAVLRRDLRDRHEQDFDAELDSHLALHIDDNLRAGMSPAEARRVALLKLGGIQATRQLQRERRTVPIIEHLLQDLRFALRQLRRSPAFALTAIIVLALGVCGSVTIFAFVDAALIQPLPYREPSRLVGVYEKTPLGSLYHLSYLDYVDWKRTNRVFSALETYSTRLFTMRTAAGVQAIDGVRVSAGMLRLFGVTPILGRDFRDGEDLPPAPRTALLTYGTWQKRFGGRADVLGETLTLEGQPYTIIGVLPADFHFAPAEPAEIWTSLYPECQEERGCHDLSGVARLADGVSVEAAQAEMTGIAAQLEKQYPDSNRNRGATILPLTDLIVGDIRPILLTLLSGAGLLLAIACINVASLLLVRSESRKREIAVRGALGASRARLLSQFITEGVVLAAVASVLGVSGASVAMRTLATAIPAARTANMPFLQGLGFNLDVALFAAAITVLMAVLFAITPALRMSSKALRDGLTEGSRGSAGTVWRRLGAHLVTLEIAAAMVLLVSAALLGQSFYRLMQVDAGLQPDNLATVRVVARGAAYQTDPQILALGMRVLERVSRLPGIAAADLANALPMSGAGGSTGIWVAGRPYNGEPNQVLERYVSAGYFTTLRARLLRGRYFGRDEDATRPAVAIINQTLARQYFPNQEAVGQRVIPAGEPESPMEVVGVINDIREGALDGEPQPAIYRPFPQFPTRSFSVIVRAADVRTESLFPSLAAAIREADPNVAVFGEAVMRDRIHESPSAYMRRTAMWMVGAFAAVALLLGTVGLYGVTAYSVSQRTREIGVRMALGAQRGSVYRLVLKDAGRVTALGMAVGIAGSAAAGSLLGSLLFGIHAWDAPTIVAVAGVLASASLLASYIPARRAASVNPVEALRAK